MSETHETHKSDDHSNHNEPHILEETHSSHKTNSKEGTHASIEHNADNHHSTNHDGVLLWSGLALLVLLASHWILPRLKHLRNIDISILNSICGGIALGFVLLHILPEVIVDVQKIKHVFHLNILNNHHILIFFTFFLVLIGFLILYSLEKVAHDSTKEGNESSGLVYALHIGVLYYLTFSVGFNLAFYAHEGLYVLALFTIAIACHFMLDEHAIAHHFPTRFDNSSRIHLSVAAVIGWGMGYFCLLNNIHYIDIFMNAFLAGALILSTVKTEFSLFEGRSHYPTFLISLLIEGIMVILMISQQSLHHG